MRGLLGRLGLRGSIVVGLVILVLGIVAVAKLAGGTARSPNYSSGAQPTSTVDPTAGDDGEVASPVAYPDDADVSAAGASFSTAWLRRDLSAAAWHTGIAPLCTASLAQSLEGVDPLGVPATRTTDNPRILVRSDLVARVGVSMDTGMLLLDLSKHDKKWLVENVDWQPL